MCDVGSCFGDVAVHLAHDADVLVTVEERVFFLALDAHVTGPRVRRLVGLERCMRQNDNQALRVLVGGRDGDMLLGDQLRKLRWR